jgi:hypothetical protein
MTESEIITEAVYVGMPYSGNPCEGAVRSLYRTASQKRHTFCNSIQMSLLCMAFNSLWCGALNRRKEGVKYFAMIHSDIVPEPWWLDTLIDELEAHNADVVSAVVPIKNDEGVTSTAIDDPENPFCPMARLTVKQTLNLPKTFSAKDVGFPDRALLVNTGLFVCRFDQPWVEKIHFNIKDRIVVDKDGTFWPEVEPEDWGFSKQLHSLRRKVMATTAVRLSHVGNFGYGNAHAWGMEVDPNHPEAIKL